MKISRFILGAALALCVAAGAASPGSAADRQLKPYYTQTAPYNWSGLYVFGHAGYALGDVDLSGVVTVEPKGIAAGVGLGYNFHVLPYLVVGVEGDGSWISARDTGAVGPVGVSGELQYLATIRGRAGYVFGTGMLYGTAGYAYGGLRGDVLNFSAQNSVDGLVYGAGYEWAISQNFRVRAEWLRANLNGDLNFGPGTLGADTTVDIIRAAVVYRFGG